MARPRTSSRSTATSARCGSTSVTRPTAPRRSRWPRPPTCSSRTWRPGRWGASASATPTSQAVNPGVVYASISGFGTGAGAAMPGYDLLVQAMGGLMSITGPAPDQPTKVGVALVDVLTGLHATVGILAALHERSLSGLGQQVSVNLLSSTLSALVNQAQAVVGAGAVPRAMGNAHPSIAPYETLPTEDGVLVLAVGNDRQFASLCEVLGLDLAGDPDFATNPARVAHRDALAGRLSEVLIRRPTAQWVADLTAAGCPGGTRERHPGSTRPGRHARARPHRAGRRGPDRGQPDHPVTHARRLPVGAPQPTPGTRPWLTSSARPPPRRLCSSRCAPGSFEGTSPPEPRCARRTWPPHWESVGSPCARPCGCSSPKDT